MALCLEVSSEVLGFGGFIALTVSGSSIWGLVVAWGATSVRGFTKQMHL